MKTAMIIPKCSHNYCSYCIRNHFSYKKNCPLCLENVLEMDLRNNRSLDAIIKLFKALKPKLLAQLNVVTTNSSSITKNSEDNDQEQKEERMKGNDLKSQDLLIWDNSEDCSAKSPQAVSKKPNSKIGGLLAQARSPQQVLEEVKCPVCLVGVPKTGINSHLDACLKRKDDIFSPVRDDDDDVLMINKPATPKRKHLPKFVYNLLSEKDLRKKLAEIGLPTKGDKQKLIKRHQEYTLIYNSQCDSVNPKSTSEIVQDVIAAENEKNKLSSPLQALRVSKTATAEENEKARKEYVKKHKSQYDELIAAAGKNWKTKNAAPDAECVNVEVEGKSSLGETTSGFSSQTPSSSKKCIALKDTPASKRSLFSTSSAENLSERNCGVSSIVSKYRDDDEDYYDELFRDFFKDLYEPRIALEDKNDDDEARACDGETQKTNIKEKSTIENLETKKQPTSPNKSNSGLKRKNDGLEQDASGYKRTRSQTHSAATPK